MIRRIALSIPLCAMLLFGCAAIPAAAALGAMAAVPGGDRTTEGVAELAALPPQALAPGQCALFLFARGTADFLAFADAQGRTLTLNPDGRARVFAGIAPLAAPAGGFTQTYRDADGAEARMTATLSPPAAQAVLRLSLPDGSARVTPLSGVLSCGGE